MLSRTLKMAFWVLYDHIGKLIVANLVWALAVLVPAGLLLNSLKTGVPGIMLTIGGPAALVLFGMVLPVTTVGMAYMFKGLIDARDGSVADMFRGIRVYGVRAIAVGVLLSLAVLCLCVSAWFYATRLQSMPWVGFLISAMAIWCLVFVALMALLAMPALVQRKAGVAQTLKLTALLVLDNPLFCVGLAVQVFGVLALCVIPPVFVFFGGAAMTALVSCAYEMLSRKYALRELNAGRTPAEGSHLHTVSVNGVLVYDDQKDDYLNRGFRDFLFPWKG